jgi:hypothetical protein
MPGTDTVTELRNPIYTSSGDVVYPQGPHHP